MRVPRFLPVTICCFSLFHAACGDDCADAGCVPALFLDGSMSAQTAEALVVEACFNERCDQAELDVVSDAERCARLSLSSDSKICFAAVRDGRRPLSLSIFVVGEESPLNDGDRVTLRIDDRATQIPLIEVERFAEYEQADKRVVGCGECQAATMSF